MNLYLRNFISLILLIPICMVTGQEQVFTYRNFSARDGLRTPSFKSIAQDDSGFIWVGGDNGLYRFDGHSFKHYQSPLDSADCTVNSLLQDILIDREHQRIWLVSFSDIQYFDLEEYVFRRIPAFPENINQERTEFTSLIKKGPDLLWVSRGGHILEYNIPGQQWNIDFPSIQPPPGTDTRWAFFQPYQKDTIAIIYKNNLLLLHQKDNTFETVSAAPDEIFIRCYFDPQRRLLHIAALSGLVTIDRRNGHRYKKVFQYTTHKGVTLAHHIKEVSGFDENTLMLSGMAGHILYRPLDGTYVHYPVTDGEYGNQLSAYRHFTDREGNIWRISLADHINVLYTQNRHLTRYGPLTNASGINIEPFKTRQLNDSILLFCGSGLKGLGLIHLATGRIELVQDDRFSGGTTDLFISPDLKIYTCDGTSLFEFIPGKKIFTRISGRENEKGKIAAITKVTGVGPYLFCYGNGHFYLVDPLKENILDEFDVKTLNQTPNSTTAADISLLKSFGDTTYFRAGPEIFYYNFASFKTKPWILPEDPINHRKAIDVIDMEKDAHGHFWLASYSNGLFCYNPRQNTVENFYSGNSPLLSDYITSITLETSGRLWMGSHAYIYIMNTRTHEMETTLSPAYGIDGAGYEVEYQSASGKVSINTYPYISILHWNTFPRNVCSQPPVLTSITISGKTILLAPLHKDTSFTLTHNENNLDITFSSLCFNNAEGNRYRYKLTGIDPEWVNTTKNQVTFHRLESGTYRFELQAANNEGTWHPVTRTVTFHIRPVFYKTWWFVTGLTLLILTIAYFLYKQRIASVRSGEKLKREYDKKLAEIETKALRAQMNPHFIFNALNSIQKFIFEKDEYAASQYLTKFSRLIRLILDHSHQDFISIHSEKELLGHYLEMESLRFDHQFRYTIDIRPEIQEEWLIPSMVIQPHVENAIWHGLLHKQGDSHVLIRFEKESDAVLRIIIEDNGIGRAMAQQLKSKNVLKKKSYGSTLSAERIKTSYPLSSSSVGLTIEDLYAADGQSAGTRIVIRLPIQHIETPNTTS